MRGRSSCVDAFRHSRTDTHVGSGFQRAYNAGKPSFSAWHEPPRIPLASRKFAYTPIHPESVNIREPIVGRASAPKKPRTPARKKGAGLRGVRCFNKEAGCGVRHTASGVRQARSAEWSIYGCSKTAELQRQFGRTHAKSTIRVKYVTGRIAVVLSTELRRYGFGG